VGRDRSHTITKRNQNKTRQPVGLTARGADYTNRLGTLADG
jgi:hypothetical protein